MVTRVSVSILLFFSASVYAETCKAGERLFTHELLATDPVCIPENPQRIVAMDMGAIEMILFSERKVVGTANWLLAELSVLNPEFSEILPTIENVGYPASLEKIAQLKPDIILAVGGESGINESIDVKGASKIAPIIVANPIVYDDWKVSSEFWADALNEKVLFERLLGNYQQRITEVKVSLGERTSETVSIMSSSAYGKSLWLKSTPPAAIVSDLGFNRPDSQNYDQSNAKIVYKNARYPMISEERLDLVDADHVFVFSYPSHDKSGQKKEAKILDKLKSNPIWKSLNAVKANSAYYVGGHWWRCNSYSLANRVLDDIAENLNVALPETSSIPYLMN